MSFSSPNDKMTAKADAFGRVVSAIKSEATKEVVSLQDTQRALSMGAQAWLEAEDDDEVRRDFFARIEAAVSPAVAKKIERHPLRPASVGPIVEAARKKAEQEREEQKAKDALTREARERAKFAELKAKYEANAAVKAPESNA